MFPDVAEEGHDVELPLGPHLLQHRVDEDVGSGATDAGAGNEKIVSYRFSTSTGVQCSGAGNIELKYVRSK